MNSIITSSVTLLSLSSSSKGNKQKYLQDTCSNFKIQKVLLLIVFQPEFQPAHASRRFKVSRTQMFFHLFFKYSNPIKTLNVD